MGHSGHVFVVRESNVQSQPNIETDIIGNLQRINTLTHRIARTLLVDENGESTSLAAGATRALANTLGARLARGDKDSR